MFYFPDRSMSMLRTMAYFAITIAVFTLLTLVWSKLFILLGLFWFIWAGLLSPNHMDRAVAVAVLMVTMITAKLLY